MTQIAIIQAAPQSVPTDTTLTKDNATPFTPHLKRAVIEAPPLAKEYTIKMLLGGMDKPVVAEAILTEALKLSS